MALVKSISRVRNLAQLGQEINHLFTKHGHHMALKLCRPLLMNYYHQMDFDWREWQAIPPPTITRPGQTTQPGQTTRPGQTTQPGQTTRPGQTTQPWQTTHTNKYIKTQVPIHKLIPAPGAPLGYRYRVAGENAYPFDIYVITWQPGQKSPVHYHPVYGCSLLALEGQLQEKLFVMDRENNKLRANGCMIIKQGQSSYIDNIIGAHQICNPYDAPAVSLHIYSPKGAQVRNIPYPTDINDV